MIVPILVIHVLISIICFCNFVEVVGNLKCGKIMTKPHSQNLVGKIVGGYDVGYYKYPWFGALQIDGDTICGGSLIGPNYILTAAHCYDAFLSNNKSLEHVFMVKMGMYKSCEKESTTTVFKTTKVHIHEKYMKNKPYYDIALLKLSGDTSAYLPTCLPPKALSDNDQEAEAWIAGYGNLVDGGSNYPCEMREGRVLIYDHETCFNMVKKLASGDMERAFVNAICAGYKAGGVDSCSGDSGGPLMTINSQTSLYQLIGITSFGWGCGDKDAMGVYTDVSKYLDWIEAKSGIKPTKENENNHSDQENITSNQIADTINAIYDHVMNSAHSPQEIIIRFKNKNGQQKAAAYNRTKIIRNKHRRWK